MEKPLENWQQLQDRWTRLLAHPDWYLTIIPELQASLCAVESGNGEARIISKSQIYDFFEDRLKRGAVALGSGSSFDAERKRIDTVIVHHTSNPPGMRATRLSAIELIRLYAPYFIHPAVEKDCHLIGQPIYSGHVRGGVQVFWPYHWIVRGDGSAERLLADAEIGWHAGDWDTNCRSVAIVLDNDYAWTRPSEREITGIARIVKMHYGLVRLNRIAGHREITPKTTCPSNVFLDGQHGPGWKRDLLEYVGERAAAA